MATRIFQGSYTKEECQTMEYALRDKANKFTVAVVETDELPDNSDRKCSDDIRNSWQDRAVFLNTEANKFRDLFNRKKK